MFRGTFPPDNQYVVCATSASLLSTFAGYPVGSPSDELANDGLTGRRSSIP